MAWRAPLGISMIEREAIEDNVARSYRDLMREIRTLIAARDEGMCTSREALRLIDKIAAQGLDL